MHTVYLHTYTQTYTHIYKPYKHTYSQTYIHIYTPYTHTHTHKHIHTHIHIYTYTHALHTVHTHINLDIIIHRRGLYYVCLILNDKHMTYIENLLTYIYPLSISARKSFFS